MFCLKLVNMYDKILYSVNGCSLMVDSEKCILCITSDSDEYNEEIFLAFMEYLTSFWTYVKDNNLKYYILLDVTGATVSIMPIKFYKKLIEVLNGINGILSTHLHSTCILCKENSIIKNIFTILFSIYTPSRPMEIVDNKEEVDIFFKSNYISE
jgi:hypothetical protein